MKRLICIIKYAFTKQKMQTYGVMLIPLIILIILAFLKRQELVAFAHDLVKLNLSAVMPKLSSFISFVTLIVAVGVWFGATFHAWQDSLPKRLNVTFIGPSGEKLMECHDADLSGEDDIRSWVQQIGAQMGDGKMLFSPYSLKREAEYVSSDNKFKVYQVTLRLDKVPDGIVKGIESGKNIPRVWRRANAVVKQDSWAS